MNNITRLLLIDKTQRCTMKCQFYSRSVRKKLTNDLNAKMCVKVCYIISHAGSSQWLWNTNAAHAVNGSLLWSKIIKSPHEEINFTSLSLFYQLQRDQSPQLHNLFRLHFTVYVHLIFYLTMFAGPETTLVWFTARDLNQKALEAY